MMWQSAVVPLEIIIDKQGPISVPFGPAYWSLPAHSESTPVPTRSSLNSNEGIMSWGTCYYHNEGRGLAFYGKEVKNNGVWDDQVVSEGYCVEDTSLSHELDEHGVVASQEGGTGYPEYWQNQFCCKDSTRFKLSKHTVDNNMGATAARCLDHWTIWVFQDDPNFVLRLEGEFSVEVVDCGLGNYRVYSVRVANGAPIGPDEYYP